MNSDNVSIMSIFAWYLLYRQYGKFIPIFAPHICNNECMPSSNGPILKQIAPANPLDRSLAVQKANVPMQGIVCMLTKQIFLFLFFQDIICYDYSDKVLLVSIIWKISDMWLPAW